MFKKFLNKDSTIQRRNQMKVDSSSTSIHEYTLMNLPYNFLYICCRRNYKTMYFPGGCSQNTVRVFQWLMDSKYQSCMIGAVGKDGGMQTLRKQLEKDGVKAW